MSTKNVRDQTGAAPAAVSGALCRSLFGFRQHSIFAVFDCARSKTIRPWLDAQDLRYESLYSGVSRITLDHCAPHLVALPADHAASHPFATAVWGQAMAVFFDAAMPFEQLRLHFKKKLFVTLEGTGRAYFRFYDPRALRALLATDNGDLANWLGDAAIARMLFEVPSRDMLACLSRRTQTGVSFGRMNGDYDTQIIELAHNESTAP